MRKMLNEWRKFLEEGSAGNWAPEWKEQMKLKAEYLANKELQAEVDEALSHLSELSVNSISRNVAELFVTMNEPPEWRRGEPTPEGWDFAVDARKLAGELEEPRDWDAIEARLRNYLERQKAKGDYMASLDTPRRHS